MSYMALYRKFRPQTFEQVKGQDHIVQTLKNQIKTNRIGHAYLFTGTRGTGKTSVAKLFAKAINCINPQDGEPCNCCEICKAAAKASFMDIVEVDAASNTGVDDIRRIIDEVRYTPVKGRYKVYIIDEVHMLSGSAFNAFLKTLEEPPEYAVFILATTEPHKLPITILSRCQRYDFHRISTETIAANLAVLVEKEGVSAEPKALAYIAKTGDGSMRDSISLLDKCIAFNLGETLTYENVLATLGVVDTECFSKIFRAAIDSDAAAALKEFERSVNEGKDISQFVSDFVWYLRNLLLVQAGGSSSDELLGVSKENMVLLKEDAALVGAAVLMRYIQILSQLINEIRYSPIKQILVEVAFIKLAKPQMETDAAALADRIRQLEENCVKAPAAAAAYEAAWQSSRRQSVQETSEPKPQPSFGELQEGSIIMGDAPGCFEPEDMIMEEMAQSADFGERPDANAASEQPQSISQNAQMQSVSQNAQPQGMYRGSAEVGESWDDIVSACGNPRLRTSLRQAVIGEENSESVTIYAPDGVKLRSIKDNEEEVRNLIIKVTRRDKSIVIKPLEERGKGVMYQPAPGFPDELLSNINFEIGTEEM